MVYSYNGMAYINKANTTPGTWINFSKIILKIKYRSAYDVISL